MSVRLFLSALSYSTTSTSLSTLLWDWAPLESAQVIQDRLSKRSKGFAFAEVATPDDAIQACRAAGSMLDGRPVVISVARPRRSRRFERNPNPQELSPIPGSFAVSSDMPSTQGTRGTPQLRLDFDDLQQELIRALNNDSSLRDFWVSNSLHRLDPRQDSASGESIRRRVARLVEIIAETPSALVELDPTLFEYLIAALLASSGYNRVQLTVPSADGGVDIFASRNSGLGKSLHIVQCKRYSTKKITRPDVQLTYGVLAASQGTGATIVTTSSFTAPAAKFLEENKHRLSGLDGADLRNWFAATAQTIAPILPDQQ